MLWFDLDLLDLSTDGVYPPDLATNSPSGACLTYQKKWATKEAAQVLELGQFGFKSKFCHLLCDRFSSGVLFLISKMGIIIIPMSRDCCKIHTRKSILTVLYRAHVIAGVPYSEFNVVVGNG